MNWLVMSHQDRGPHHPHSQARELMWPDYPVRPSLTRTVQYWIASSQYWAPENRLDLKGAFRCPLRPPPATLPIVEKDISLLTLVSYLREMTMCILYLQLRSVIHLLLYLVLYSMHVVGYEVLSWSYCVTRWLILSVLANMLFQSTRTLNWRTI